MSKDLTRELKSIPLFAKLDRDDLRAIADIVKRVHYAAGRVICRQGKLGETAYYVESGELRVLRVDAEGVEREVARLGPEDFFGETSLLLGEPRDATVEVVQDATLLSLDKDEFNRLLRDRSWMRNGLKMSGKVARKVGAQEFKWQEADEIIVVHLRKHGLVLFRELLFPSIVLLVILVGSVAGGLMLGASWPLIVGLVLSLLPLLFITYLTIDYVNDNYIVTNKRVVHQERVPLIRESRVEAPLRAIQNIQQVQQGILAQIYDFGNLIIETAGERGHVVFREIPHPEETRTIIFDEIERLEASAKAEELADIRNALRHRFGKRQPQQPATASPQEQQPSSVLESPRRILSYLLPPLRYEQGDTITWRKHWIALIGPIWLPTLLIIAATVITVLIVGTTPESTPSALVGYGTLMMFLIPWWIWQFDDWRNDIYQVTLTRIIDVERLPFYLREERREASLGMIQNINLEVPGIWGKLFNYGSVVIETAGGGSGAFTFDLVKNPHGVQSEIFQRVEEFHTREAREATERHRTELLDWFTVYDQIRSSSTSQDQSSTSDRQEP